MTPSLLRVALSGGIATGKSHCLVGFAALGVPVVDADQIARQVVAPGTAGFQAVVARFGQEVVGPTGELDRQALGRVVFADPAARRDLEALTHPGIYARIEQWFQRHEGGAAAFAMADIPLLYETGHDRDFDRTVVAACSPAQQRERLILRGLSAADAEQRLTSQLPIDLKIRRATYVIDTSGTPAATDRQVVEVWEKLRAEARAAPPNAD